MSTNAARLDEVFAAAAAETAPAARAAYLDQVCDGNPELRDRVEALLVAHDAAGSFLKLPSGGATTSFVALSERPGSTIGRYKLLEQIGEGGFGVVFMAEQERPVRRRVALKIIKAGMDTRQVVARFEAERQALAMMDHPNIAKVFDAGTTETGRPYFVMELVRGVPITEHCDRARLTADERLKLFQSVCGAVQHAHQKGIIHRDLKPSNVLVTLHDDKAVPKVIDFGVAKATQARLTERTLFTEFRQMVGTPAYMSPEQAQMSGLDVDTRSDVYSLGVLLYELLTGSTPIDAKQLSSASYDDLRRLICEVEPLSPSARLSALTREALTTLADRRHCVTTELAVSLRSDLDWIVMKCLEKDRARRYESASALALDVQRYLDGQPVGARPPTTGYRLRKFVRRNRGAVLAGGLVAAALLVGISIATWQAVRATRAETIALANSEKARRAVDEYFTLVSESTLLNVPGLQPLRKELLDAALRFYEGHAAADANDPAALADLAVGYMRVAMINQSVDRSDDAVAAVDRALEVIEQLRTRFPNAQQEHRRLAGFWKGNRNLTQIKAPPKDPDAAFHSFHRLLELMKAFAEEHPDQSAFRTDLAALYFLTGDLLSDNGQFGESLPYFDQAIAASDQLVREQPDVPEHRADLARAYEQQGRSLLSSYRVDEAEAASTKALALRERLAAEFPDSPQYRGELGSSLMQACQLTIDRDPQQVKQLASRAKDLFEGLAQEYPEAVVYRSEFRTARKWLAESSIATHDPDQVKEGIAGFNEWAATQPDDPRSQLEYAAWLRRIANRVQANKELQPLIEDALHSALATFVELSDQHPEIPELREQVGHFHRHLGFNDRDADRLEEAKRHFEQAIVVFQWLTDADIPQRNGFYRSFLVDSCADLALVLMREGKAESVETDLTARIQANMANRPLYVQLLRLRGELRRRLGRWPAAAADFRTLVEIEPDDHWPHCLLASLLVQVGDTESYHDHGAQMLRRFAGTDHPGVAHRIVKFSLILPSPEADFETLSDLADMALASGPSHTETPLFQLTKGLVEFRQGNFSSAAEWMERALEAPPLHYHHAQAALVLAMARHALNDHEAADAAFKQGSEYIRQDVPKPDAAGIGPNWADSIIAYALRREAQALLGPDAP